MVGKELKVEPVCFLDPEPPAGAEPGLNCRKAFGKVGAEGDGSVVDCFKVTVQVQAAAAEFADMDVVSAVGARGQGIRAKCAAGEGSARVRARVP